MGASLITILKVKLGENVSEKHVKIEFSVRNGILPSDDVLVKSLIKVILKIDEHLH